MKTAEIKDILKKDLLIVELPENGYYEEYRDGIEVRDFLTDEVLTLANYTLLGSPDEIKEEDAKELVESWESVAKDGTMVYKNYKDGIPKKRTALESFNSALEKEILWENPYGKEPIENLQSSTFGGEKTIIHRNPMNILWNEAESRTFDKKRVKMFVKINTMKETYLKILELLDTSIFQNYKIIDEEEIPIEQSELVTCIENSITIKIEMLVDFSWYEPKKYNESEVTQIRSGWIWEFFSFDEEKELYDLLAEIGYDDDFWKNWLNQSWGIPEYHQIWDGEELFEDDFFNSIEDAKEYNSVWTIKGTIEIEFNCFENE